MNRLFSGILLMSLLLAGCVGLPAPQGGSPDVYVLDALPAVQTPATRRDLVLAVNMPQARPGFETARMAYFHQAHELNYYTGSRWTDTPARMLQPLLLQTLEQGGAFRAVVRAGSSIPADVRLDVELVRLQQDFTASPSRVQVTLQAQLLDLRGRRVLAAKQFDAVEEAASEDAYGGVGAANRAVQRLLGEVAEFCAEASGRQ